MKTLKAGNTTTDIFKHTFKHINLEQLDKKQILLQPCNIQRSTLHLTGCDEKFRTHQQIRLLVKSDYFACAVPKSLQMDITCTGHFVLIYCVT